MPYNAQDNEPPAETIGCSISVSAKEDTENKPKCSKGLNLSFKKSICSAKVEMKPNS